MRPLILIVCIFFLLTGCNRPYSVQEQDVAEIVSTLSSDEMRGRHALSSDIEKAEKFIASNFNKAGLSYFGELDSYHQKFSLIELSVIDSNVEINGEQIPNTNFFTFLYDTSVTLNEQSAKIEHIKRGESFGKQIRKYSSAKESVIVFVDESFENMFARYQSYYSRPHRFLDQTEKGNVIFILSDETPANFNIDITSAVEQKELGNVVGTIPGIRSDEIVLFSAHHDHIGIREIVDGDSIGNGANDNASGVTAVLKLAKYFNSQPQPERTIMFVTFTAEEVGGYGSEYFSFQLNPDEIVAMFNIEMIGKPAVSGPNTAWVTGYNLSTFGELLSKSTEGTEYEFYPDPYPQQNLFFRSDNTVFARLGVPAHTISTTPIDVDTDYHTVHDEFHTLDLAHLTNTIKAIAKAAEGIISGEDTPSRIDTERID